MSACPNLGLKHDPDSYRSYESVQNYCYHCKSAAPIIFLHQKNYCVTENHINCRVYKEPERCEFPVELKGNSAPDNTGRLDWKWIVIGTVVILLLLFVGFVVFSGASIQDDKLDFSLKSPSAQTETQIINPTAYVNLSTENNLVGVFEGTTGLPKDPYPSATISVDITATLEIYSLVIHQVQEGESLVVLAQEYDTTPDAIIDINYGLPTPIWAGWALVIPKGNDNTESLPYFEVFFLAQDIGLDDFSTQRNCNREELKRYNDNISGEMIMGGQWVLIPREKNK